ncbi:MAG: diacylglycerol/lipid kinase family protein [Candidatus Dormibacteria bacterium]
MNACFIVNPASANGSTGRRWELLSRRVTEAGLPHTSLTTGGPGHAIALARGAVEAGASLVVAVGGDGTMNEVANGVLQAGERGVAVGLLPLGTGGDFRRTLGLPENMDRAVAAFIACRTRAVDVGHIAMTGLDGIPAERWFVNIADAGIGGVVVERVNRTSKMLGGRISFLYASMATLLSFRPQEVRVESAEGRFEGRAQNVVVANGQYFGGGMWVAPGASPDDGLLDVVVLGDIARFEALRSIGDIYKAKHLENPKVRSWRSAEVRVSSPERVLLDVDGEMCGTLPATFRVVPHALQVVVP